MIHTANKLGIGSVMKKANSNENIKSAPVAQRLNTITSNVVMAAVPSPTSTPTSPKGVEVSKDEIISYIDEKFGIYSDMAICIADHEDGTYDPTRININDDIYHSEDVGIFQINLHYHPDVTYSEMINWQENVDEAYRLSEGGTNWNPWATKHYCI